LRSKSKLRSKRGGTKKILILVFVLVLVSLSEALLGTKTRTKTRTKRGKAEQEQCEEQEQGSRSQEGGRAGREVSVVETRERPVPLEEVDVGALSRWATLGRIREGRHWWYAPEWTSLLQQIVGSPDHPWPRWQALRERTRQMTQRIAASCFSLLLPVAAGAQVVLNDAAVSAINPNATTVTTASGSDFTESEFQTTINSAFTNGTGGVFNSDDDGSGGVRENLTDLETTYIRRGEQNSRRRPGQ